MRSTPWLLAAALVIPSADAALAYPPHTSYQLPMEDGLRLNTEVWFPQNGPGPWPVIFCRTPYRAEVALDWNTIVLLGYVAVAQDVRGFYESEGEFEFFRAEGWGPAHEDGAETLEWMVQQPWCNGNVGTIGGSAVGITQNLLMGTAPPGLRCAHVTVGAGDLYLDLAFPGGELRKADIEGWLGAIGYPALRDTFEAHAVKDAWWSWTDVGTRYEQVETPSYQVAGWYDLILRGGLSMFSGLQYDGAPGALGNQKLIVGPWAHGIGGSPVGELTYPDASGTGIPESMIGSTLDWFEYWEKGVPNGILEKPPIAYYLMGDPETPGAPGNVWRAAESWPPPALETPYFLHAGGLLGREAPPAEAPPSSYLFDPSNPVPTRGGANLVLESGPYDQRPVENRADVLLFTTPPLTREVEVVGPITVVLYAASDRLDTDWTAKLTDVYPDGRSMLVCDGILRARFRNGFGSETLLVPGVIERYEIDLVQTAMVFAPGHRIRVAISSSNFPRFEVNPNNGAAFGQQTPLLAATNTVYLDAAHPSHILFPVTNPDPADTPALAESGHRGFEILPGSNPGIGGLRFGVRWSTASPATVQVHDGGGRLVRTLLRSDRPASGLLELRWDGRDSAGRPAPTGVYFLRVLGGGASASWRAQLIH